MIVIRRLGNTNQSSMAPPTNQRSRGWCFTINNYTAWDDLDIERLTEEAQYVIYGKEQGENGTPHYQGFCYFSTLKSFNQLRDLLPRAHVEKQRGTLDAAIEYCKKEGDFIERGERPYGPSGQKNQWKEVLKLARSGNMQEIEDKFPAIFLRYHSKLLGLHKPERPIILEFLENEWWVGPTGTGKSRMLWTMYPDHYSKSLNKWWDGYENQETVAIEEWAPRNEVTASFLKIWADRYPFTAEIKGGTLQKVRPKRIIVLSNYTIEECFPQAQDQEPITRRFKVKHFLNLS